MGRGHRVQQHTNIKLKSLKRLRSGKIVRIIKKRRQSRQKIKKKRKLEKLQKSLNTSPLRYPEPPIAISKNSGPDVAPDAKLLKKRHDAECFLQKFQLLERLHLVRSRDVVGTKEFARKFETLRGIWVNELRASTPHRNIEEKESLESNWNRVLFGVQTNENTLNGKQKFKEFLRIRNTWDSYLSKSPQASSIPNGWVLPHVPTSAWRKYQCQEI